MVERHSAKVRKIQEAAEVQAEMLRTRIERLTSEVEKLRASTSRGRQMLYWSSMKYKIRDSMLASTPYSKRKVAAEAEAVWEADAAEAAEAAEAADRDNEDFLNHRGIWRASGEMTEQ